MIEIQTQQMQEEIQRLVAYIADAKKEIMAMGSDVLPADASAHLDEVIQATEEASHTILDATEVIQAQVNGLGGEKEQKITDAINLIYGACNFQDITGQRITNVIRLLDTIEQRIGKLNALFGTEGDIKAKSAKPIIDANGNYNEKDLLNGPQLKGQGVSQNDVDAMFGNTGSK